MPTKTKVFQTNIKPRDSVRVVDRHSAQINQIGQVHAVEPSAIYRNRNFCRVELNGVHFGFSCEQLEKVACAGSMK